MTSNLPFRIEGDTIVDAFRHNVRRLPDRPALRRRVGAAWETLTWADYGQAVREVTAGLVESGIEPGEHVGILSNNRVEWHVADFGILANGSVTVPLYQTSSAEQVAYILGHAEARVCFVENHDLLAKDPGGQGRVPQARPCGRLRERRPTGPVRRSVRGELRRPARESGRPASSANPTCSTPGPTRCRRSTSPPSSTRAVRRARPRAR